MKVLPRLLTCSVLPGSCIVLRARQGPNGLRHREIPSSKPPERDGQHDFDFELGTWKIHLKRLVHALTGSNTWIEFDGTSVTRSRSIVQRATSKV
jgi:hypothetical protein